jgi:hypothetical protein
LVDERFVPKANGDCPSGPSPITQATASVYDAHQDNAHRFRKNDRDDSSDHEYDRSSDSVERARPAA